MEVSNGTLTTAGASVTATSLYKENELTTVGWIQSFTEGILDSTSENTDINDVELKLVESLCKKTAVILFMNPCFGAVIQFSGISNLIALMGMTLNIISFIALNTMKLSFDTLLMMKCLCVYDSLYLFAALWLIPLVYIPWLAGSGHIQHTTYYFVYHMMVCLYRISMAVAFWLVCLLTAHRYSHKTCWCEKTNLFLVQKLQSELSCFRFIKLKFLQKDSRHSVKKTKFLVAGLTFFFIGLEIYYYFLYQASVLHFRRK